MKQFLVIRSQHSGSGRGVNGRTLFKFLETYVGRRGVEWCDLDDLLDSRGMAADYVFLGLPGKVTHRHLAKLRYRHLILYDLTDEHRLMWDETNEAILRKEASAYFKAWTDDRWDFGIQMGLLPVRRYGKVRLFLLANQIGRCLRLATPRRKFDVMFLGAATGTQTTNLSATGTYNERIEWLQELKKQGQHLSFWGGLIDRNHALPAELVAKYGDLSELLIRGRVSFWKYFWALQQARVALTPQGHAPWSYRHYEAIYAGAVVVTSDLRQVRTLVPLPLENMVQVEPRTPVLLAIEKALELRRQRPHVLKANLQFLERYLEQGMYSRQRPELFERFLAQLPTATSPIKSPATSTAQPG